MGTINLIVYALAFLLWSICMNAAVERASRYGRSVGFWILMSFIFTPVIAILLLLVYGETERHREERIIRESSWGRRNYIINNIVSNENRGTLHNPIPFDKDMVVFCDKYYLYNGEIYQCIRDSGVEIPFINTPDKLIDLYFKKC